jgi:hypothetical protein
MLGRRYDVLFYFLPLLFGIACFLMARFSPLSTSGFFVLILLDALGAGPFHWGPSWYAYWDKKNRDYWKSSRTKQAVFFAGPALVMAFAIACSFISPWLIAVVSMLWAVQHLVQQNVGILLLYHNQNSGEAIVDRVSEVRSQHAPAFLFMSIFFWRVLLKQPDGAIYGVIGFFLLAWTLWAVGSYLYKLRRLVLDGACLNVPAFVFWLMSVVAIAPVAFLGKNFGDGFVIPVTIHWFQYIGLNYMLIKYKYGPGEPQVADLPKVAPVPLFICTCAVWVVAIYVVHWLLAYNVLNPVAATFAAGLYIGLADIHYLQDAFLWRFREPHVRQATLPFLLRARQAARS